MFRNMCGRGHMFKEPRLIVDWNNTNQHHGAHITSQELFFNVCFAVLFGSLRTQYFNGGLDGWMFVREFLLTWGLINTSADYATRFNDEDVFHVLLWGVYGVGLAGTLMHVQNQIHFSMALTQLWISVAWFRVAYYVKRCRMFALWDGAVLVVSGCTLIIVGSQGLQRTWIGWIPVVLHPLATVFAAYALPRSEDIPMNVEYHVPKFQGMAMLVMGQLVIVAATPPPTGERPDDLFQFYVNAGCTVLWLFMFKLVLTDCDVTLDDNHAIKRSKASALTWLLFCHPLLNLLIVLCATGVMYLHQASNTGITDGLGFGNQLIAFTSAGMFAVVLLKQQLHAPEGLVEKTNRLRQHRLAWRCSLAISAVVCVAVGFAETNPLPFTAVSALVCAKVGWWNKTAVVIARALGEEPLVDHVDMARRSTT